MARSLDELAESLDAADDPELWLLDRLIDDADSVQAGLGDVLRLCAIPRRLDATILGVLRDRPEPEEANARLIERLVDYSFVLRREDGSFVYHEDTRTALLQWWAADPVRRARFHDCNRRLAEHYVGRRAETTALEQDLARVADLLRGAWPSRYAQLAAAVDGRIGAAIMESLYHATMAGIDDGFARFDDAVYDYARHGRPFAWSMLDAMRRHLLALPYEADRRRWEQWLRLWEIRLRWKVERDVAAEADYHALLAEEGLDPVFRKQALDDLGDLLYDEERLAEAEDVYTTRLHAAEASRDDPEELAVAHGQIAGIATQLNKLERAEAHYWKALEYGRQADLAWVEPSVRIGMIVVQHGRGDWDGALDSLLRVLRVFRASLPATAQLQPTLSAIAMLLAYECEDGWLDVLANEATSEQSPLAGALEAKLNYARLLCGEGRLAAAERCLDAVAARSEEPEATPAIRAQLITVRGEQLQQAGRLEEGIARVTPIAAGEGGEPVSDAVRADALLLRGKLLLHCGRFGEAVDDLDAAIALWRAAGSTAKLSGALVWKATAAVWQGRLDDAGAMLDEAQGAPGDPETIDWYEWHFARAQLHQARGRLEDATHELERAVELAVRFRLPDHRGRALAKLAELAADVGDWDAAARHHRSAAQCWRGRADRAARVPTADEIRALEENAAGMQVFCGAVPDRVAAVASAREHFRAAADRAPGIAWYALNLGFACLELTAWDEAAEAFGRARAVGPHWARQASIVSLVVYARTHQANELLDRGRPAEARDVVRAVADDLGRRLDDEDRVVIDLLLGDAEVMLDDIRAGARAFGRARQRVERTSDPELLEAVRAREGLIAAVQGDWDTAIDVFARSDQPAEALIGVALSAARSEPVARAVNEVARIVERPSGAPPDAAVAAKRAVWSFTAWRGTLRPLNRPPLPEQLDDKIPIAPAIELEADPALFPQMGATPEVIRMLDIDIPDARRRLQAELGFEVPSVQMRAADLGPGRYRMLFNGVLFGGGIVDGARFFTPDRARCDELGIDGDAHPRPDATGDGLWFDAAHAEAVTEHGLPLWDAYLYIVRHLESVIRDHIEQFVFADGVAQMIERWAENRPERAELAQLILDEPHALGRMTVLVRSLLADCLPVHELEPLMTAVASGEKDGVVEEPAR